MDLPGRHDAHTQDVPLLSPLSRLPPRRLRAHDAPWRTALLISLAGIHIFCNLAVLFVSFHRYRFGFQITKDTWWITDKALLSVVEPFSNILYAITSLLGGWALSHLWSIRLGDNSSAGLAEMQSFQIYQSIPTILSSMRHILRRHYISAQWLYAAVIISAILFQFYTTAIITLITPSISSVEHERNYTFAKEPFMASPGYGTRCSSPQMSSNMTKACLGLTLSGTAFIDIEQFSGKTSHDTVTEVGTSYTTPNRSVSAALLLQYINGTAGGANGSMLFGINLATVERVALESSDIWNSFSFEISIETRLPALTCRCALQDPNTSNISSVNIFGTSYTLLNSIPDLEHGQVTGQVTTDNMTLIISIPSSEYKRNVHCMVKLSLTNSSMSITGVSHNPGTDPESIALRSLIVTSQAPISCPTTYHEIRAFADIWLLGPGWSSNATFGAAALVDFLGAMPVATGGSQYVSGSQSLESYILVMLANGIGAAFSPESMPSDNSSSSPTRRYRLIKSEYVLGITSRWQYIYIVIVILDTLFVLLCASIILSSGWFPDFTDPVTFARAAVYGGSGIAFRNSGDVDDNPLFPPESSVPLVHGEGQDQKLWKERFSLKEIADGNRRILVFEPKAVSETMSLD